MLKCLTVYLFISVLFLGCLSNSDLNGLWILEDNKSYLRIENDSAYIESGHPYILEEQGFKYRVNADTIIFELSLNSPHFLILKQTSDSLVLQHLISKEVLSFIKRD